MKLKVFTVSLLIILLALVAAAPLPAVSATAVPQSTSPDRAASPANAFIIQS